MNDQLLILLEQFLAYLKVEKGLANNTVLSYGTDLRQFFSFLASRKIFLALDITNNHIRDFCQERFDNQISAKSLHRNICAQRRFFRFLIKEKIIKNNPVSDIHLPKVEKTLPRFAKVSEIEVLLKSPSKNSLRGMRDAAIIAMFYATGLRVSELINLKLSDIEYSRGFLKTLGKGKKERVVPLN